MTDVDWKNWRRKWITFHKHTEYSVINDMVVCIATTLLEKDDWRTLNLQQESFPSDFSPVVLYNIL